MTENKYQRGKIYKLVSAKTDDVYYGSTIENKLTNRLASHRRNYKRLLNGKYHYVSSFEIVKYDDCRIILVENFPCNTVYELLARENYYVENNVCVNRLKPFLGLTKYEYNKQYYIDNKNEIDQRKKHYYIENKNELNEKQKKYIEKNEEKLKEKRKQTYQCVCGSITTVIHKKRHERSLKHQKINNEANLHHE